MLRHAVGNARLRDAFLSRLVAIDQAVSDNPVQPVPAALCEVPDASPAATARRTTDAVSK
jgi:hypothetical protein